ncbi:hypothetical protein C2G38_2313763 [Gigaspora rosea]|uniref:Uncharacterized protein n=1 Tax=Gigaspora rosea TaxID=44941 RepID=A0A397VBT2_9GLOM|nr:hypothetical protein C2G38_2313763 [Gigaspora rosea]
MKQLIYNNEYGKSKPGRPLIDISKIDRNTRAYIDTACQASANSIIDSIKSYIDQSMGLQFSMINKLNKRLDEYANQQPTQNVQQKEKNPMTVLKHNHEYNSTAASGSNAINPERSLSQQGNCLLTSILNNFIISAAKQPNEKSPASSNEAQGISLHNKAIKVRATTRMYPALDYSDLANLHLVHGFHNHQAASIEQIRLWWVLNWNKDQKIIEMLPNKLNLPSTLWKAIAFEWLLAFKSYMDAVLIIYPAREQELNTYRDNINMFCVKHDFSAVAVYDEDKRLHLTINQDTTLTDRDIEAEGENFDMSTIKRHRPNIQRNQKHDITWYDRRQYVSTGTVKVVPKNSIVNEFTHA